MAFDFEVRRNTQLGVLDVPSITVREKDCLASPCLSGVSFKVYKARYYNEEIVVKLMKLLPGMKRARANEQRERIGRLEENLVREGGVIMQAPIRGPRQIYEQGEIPANAGGRGRARGRGGRGNLFLPLRAAHPHGGVMPAGPVVPAGQVVPVGPVIPAVNNGQQPVPEIVERELPKEPEPLDPKLMVQLQTLSHENVARFIGSFNVTIRGKLYPYSPSYQYVRGGTLEQALQSHQMFRRELGHSVIFEIACGLEYLHIRGHAHGFLRPSNVLFKDPSQTHIMITDYCLPERYHMKLTSPYIERAEGQPYSALSDIFSLAAIAVGIVQNEDLDALPDQRHFRLDLPFAELRRDYHDRYDLIMNGLFEKGRFRPTASDFRAGFAPQH